MEMSAAQRLPWVNWGRTARCIPEYTFYPTSLDDLVTIVNFARSNGKTIRAVASGHSWSALAPTDDILVSVRKLNKVSLDVTDEDHPLVVMECGATVREVNDVLEQHGYALPFNVVLESVRLGGLIATGSHGSGWNHQTLSDLVQAIEIVTATGELRRFEAGVDDEEVMNAVRLNLGMFGLIYRITLRIHRSYTVRALDRHFGIEETLANLQEWVPAHENLDIFWWPFTDRCWIKQWDPIDAPVTGLPRRSLRDRARSAVEMRLLDATIRSLKWGPQFTPGVCRVIFPFTPSRRDAIVPLVDAVHYRRGIELFRAGCVEVAFKVDADFTNVKWAMQLVFDQTRAYAARGQYPFNVTMNVRFIKDSHCLLSPAFGDGHTCYIEILSQTKQEEWEAFSADIAREWLTLPHALPHWAKEFEHIPHVIEHIRTAMGPNIARFNRIKADLGVDPNHMFVNAMLRRIFLDTSDDES
jgi:FAD/FMN-containing dehydrogenase